MSDNKNALPDINFFKTDPSLITPELLLAYEQEGDYLYEQGNISEAISRYDNAFVALLLLSESNDDEKGGKSIPSDHITDVYMRLIMKPAMDHSIAQVPKPERPDHQGIQTKAWDTFQENRSEIFTLIPQRILEIDGHGDALLANGEIQGALAHYRQARKELWDYQERLSSIDSSADSRISQVTLWVGDYLGDKVRTIEDVHTDPDWASHVSPQVAVDLFRTMISDNLAEGKSFHASVDAVRLGEVLAAMGDIAGAEEAYRQAVMFARDHDTNEFFPPPFRQLVELISPSWEAVALADELVASYASAGSSDASNSGRLQAAEIRATALLDLAQIAPDVIDEALEAVHTAKLAAAKVTYKYPLTKLFAKRDEILAVLGA
ncbi:MAG: hypothetical protein FWG25_06270 [Promicromonosporaceae bacterium]|nr:hypothetical protein [Promicromonosporaceae bacterium]